jgi:hypothetical protein
MQAYTRMFHKGFAQCLIRGANTACRKLCEHVLIALGVHGGMLTIEQQLGL